MRSNKISTTKCLSQLAANYGSLHAINLEGNPAQRNVGDEQLKKYLVSLLPKLVYYNKQIIRVGSSKEVVVDRAHQFDRGLKSEYKHARKGNASTAHKPVTSRGRHGRVLPPTGPKGNHQSSGSRLLSLREFNMPRSMSEGTLLS
ncbi:hypothetical protein QJS10_CPB11g01072 [Acorus calamus]|uniref:Uncharacterized protein n=1 Tax=Acorus calamus TaxID=4465 RepID=A0AAV9DTW7_ACOCL|nr:hypothetical protein QJS10_CPB11g01072 [Acorus calamus]